MTKYVKVNDNLYIQKLVGQLTAVEAIHWEMLRVETEPIGKAAR